MKQNKKIGILIVAYNAVTTLSKVLDRIPKNVLEEIDEIAVFDDASKDETYMLSVGYKEVKKLDKLQIYLNEKNLGYGGNQKRGFKYFIDKDFDAVVLLHGDGQYAPEVLQEMYDPIVSGKADVVLGSRMMSKYGGALKGGMPFYKYVGNKALSTYQNITLKMNLTEFHSGYRAFSVDGLRKIHFDNMTDDFHFDTQIIVKANHNNLKITEVPIPTFYGEEICYVNGVKYAKDIIRTVRDYKKTLKGKKKVSTYEEFYTRYPIKLYPFSSHYEVMKILNEKENLDILEICYGGGSIAGNISKQNRVSGLGFRAPSDSAIRSYIDYHQCDLNSGVPAELLENKKYDVVLLMDMLEHLQNYQYILNDSKKILKDGGRVIVSIPNIANLYVRLNLLIGRFPYADRGLLDRNHLHFFTYGSAKKLLSNNRLEIIKTRYTPIPIIEVLPVFLKKNVGRLLNLVLFLLSILFIRLFTYQFIFITKKEE
ncbi:MAG: glycosyltransferase [Ignavibacteria bacterium]|nr:glycosyltransferase [Ignavibacteria bacterium]